VWRGILPWNDVFSAAFTQCELEDRFVLTRPSGCEQQAFYFLGDADFFWRGLA
jgi:hypothetical protein